MAELFGVFQGIFGGSWGGAQGPKRGFLGGFWGGVKKGVKMGIFWLFLVKITLKLPLFIGAYKKRFYIV